MFVQGYDGTLKGSVKILGVQLPANEVDLSSAQTAIFPQVPASCQKVTLRIKIEGYEAVERPNIKVASKISIQLQPHEMRPTPRALSGVPRVDPEPSSPFGFSQLPSIAFPVLLPASHLPGSFDVELKRKQRGAQSVALSPATAITVIRGEKGTWQPRLEMARVVGKDRFGNYSVKIVSRELPQPLTADIKYIYSADLSDPAGSFDYVQNDTPSRVLPGSLTAVPAMVIVNKTTSGGYVQAKAKTNFDFKESFIIRGSYAVGPEDGSARQPAIDVSIGDQWGERISCLLGEDQGRGFSIKFMREPVAVEGSEGEFNKITTNRPLVRPGEDRLTHFAITIKQSGAGVLCSIFCADSEIVSVGDTPAVFQRLLPGDALGAELTKVTIRLWQRGWAKVFKLEVADLSV